MGTEIVPVRRPVQMLFLEPGTQVVIVARGGWVSHRGNLTISTGAGDAQVLIIPPKREAAF